MKVVGNRNSYSIKGVSKDEMLEIIVALEKYNSDLADTLKTQILKS